LQEKIERMSTLLVRTVIGGIKTTGSSHRKAEIVPSISNKTGIAEADPVRDDN